MLFRSMRRATFRARQARLCSSISVRMGQTALRVAGLCVHGGRAETLQVVGPLVYRVAAGDTPQDPAIDIPQLDSQKAFLGLCGYRLCDQDCLRIGCYLDISDIFIRPLPLGGRAVEPMQLVDGQNGAPTEAMRGPKPCWEGEFLPAPARRRGCG